MDAPRSPERRSTPMSSRFPIRSTCIRSRPLSRAAGWRASMPRRLGRSPAWSRPSPARTRPGLPPMWTGSWGCCSLTRSISAAGFIGAVIAGGLSGLSAGGIASWPLLLAASACLALTWLLTIVCVGRFLWSLASRGLAPETIDGAWFLVPAALLGAATATEDVAALVASRGASVLALLALGGALLGWFGYWVVAVVAFVRARRFGLGGVPQAPWWIAMRCAGLAAAALGGVLDGAPPWPALRAFLIAATTVTDICAVALLIPVVADKRRLSHLQADPS